MTNDRLAARLRQIRRVRRRVVAATLATFVLAWGVIAYDGAMGSSSPAVAASGAAAARPAQIAGAGSSALTTRQS